jgi:hypothetical protein
MLFQRIKLVVLPCAALAVLAACGGGDSGGNAPSYTVGGTITGLSAPGLVLVNGSDTLSPAANATAFAFPASVSGTSYDVAIKVQPNGLKCTVTSASGAVASAKITSVAISCPSPWVWMGGTQANNAPAVYGAMGVAAAANTPGGRSIGASWTDAAGNLWIFGGYDTVGALGDLWEYAPGTGLWTWVSGLATHDFAGIYGTQGVADAGNHPGARSGSATWIDGAGDLWLFGGYGHDSTGGNPGQLNDLWEFSLSTGLWTWMGGAQTVNSMGNYGTLGAAAASNLPPAREGANAWRDKSGNFWLFGGLSPAPIFASPSTSTGLLNDVWMYNLQSGLWTWVGGSNEVWGLFSGSGGGVYGTQGMPAAGNIPTPRSGAVEWTDGQGNFWLFGGGYAGNGQGTALLNDLWQLNPTTGLWAWMSGSNMPGDALSGIYGDEGTPAAANVPGARSQSSTWTDRTGKLWLLGGVAEGSNPDACCSTSNDLWSYDPGSGEWTWVSGSMADGTTPPGVYGTLGTPGVGNVPGGRAGAVTFVDGSGNLWLYGGWPWTGTLADLWRFTPP